MQAGANKTPQCVTALMIMWHIIDPQTEIKALAAAAVLAAPQRAFSKLCKVSHKLSHVPVSPRQRPGRAKLPFRLTLSVARTQLNHHTRPSSPRCEDQIPGEPRNEAELCGWSGRDAWEELLLLESDLWKAKTKTDGLRWSNIKSWTKFV